MKCHPCRCSAQEPNWKRVIPPCPFAQVFITRQLVCSIRAVVARSFAHNCPPNFDPEKSAEISRPARLRRSRCWTRTRGAALADATQPLMTVPSNPDLETTAPKRFAGPFEKAVTGNSVGRGGLIFEGQSSKPQRKARASVFYRTRKARRIGHSMGFGPLAPPLVIS